MQSHQILQFTKILKWRPKTLKHWFSRLKKISMILNCVHTLLFFFFCTFTRSGVNFWHRTDNQFMTFCIDLKNFACLRCKCTNKARRTFSCWEIIIIIIMIMIIIITTIIITIITTTTPKVWYLNWVHKTDLLQSTKQRQVCSTEALHNRSFMQFRTSNILALKMPRG